MLVDYYLYSGHEIDTWEPVRAALERRGVDARWVLEPPGVHTARGSSPDPARGWLDDKASRVVPLVTEASYQELLGLLAGVGATPLDRGRDHADAVVTTQGTGWLHRYRGLKLKVGYGVGASVESWNHGWINDGMDGVLTHGRFTAEHVRRRLPADRVHLTGFPKYARMLRGDLDVTAWREGLGLRPGRPTVVWACTWAQNASIERYADVIERLAEHVDVICKPHYNNLRFERARIDALRARPGIRIEETTRSLVPFLAVADLVLADVRSGSFTEAMLVDRPVVGLSPTGDPDQDRLIDGIEEAALLCGRPDDLPALVERALAHDDRAAGRRAMAAWFFEDMGGEDDERAADVVVGIVERGPAPRVPTPSPAPPPPDPWPLATEASERLVAWPRWDRADEVVDVLRRAAAVATPATCLVLRRDAACDPPGDDVVRTLEAAYGQAFPAGDVDLDVLLVDDPIATHELPRLGAAVSAVIPTPVEGDWRRSVFHACLGAPALRPGPTPPEAACR